MQRCHIKYIIESKKKERKERIELAKRARLEEVRNKKQKKMRAKENKLKLIKPKPVKENPANLKLAKSKSSKLKQKSNTLVENLISEMIENPKEVGIGQWLVAEFKEENSGGVRFIGKLLKVSKGVLRGTFLRSKMTRDFNGYIYNYPDVEDIYDFSFDQILKLLPAPETYGRGMLEFCIHAKNL